MKVVAVAATDTVAPPSHPADHVGPIARAPRSVDQVTRTPDAPRAAAPPALDYQLLTPPSYDNIVGGAPPSPIASLFLGIGAALILLAAAWSMMGTDATEWWVTGAILAAIGVFLAAFISRR